MQLYFVTYRFKFRCVTLTSTLNLSFAINFSGFITVLAVARGFEPQETRNFTSRSYARTLLHVFFLRRCLLGVLATPVEAGFEW